MLEHGEDIFSTFMAVEKEVCEDCEHKYHTTKESEKDRILENARELLDGYTFGRYIKPIVETVYVEE